MSERVLLWSLLLVAFVLGAVVAQMFHVEPPLRPIAVEWIHTDAGCYWDDRAGMEVCPIYKRLTGVSDGYFAE